MNDETRWLDTLKAGDEVISAGSVLTVTKSFAKHVVTNNGVKWRRCDGSEVLSRQDEKHRWTRLTIVEATPARLNRLRVYAYIHETKDLLDDTHLFGSMRGLRYTVESLEESCRLVRLAIGVLEPIDKGGESVANNKAERERSNDTGATSDR